VADTPGKRLYLIRLALGDGTKNPMRIDDFVALLKRKRRAVYQSSAISRTENGGRKLTLVDAEHFAAVDPQKRGAGWLAFGAGELPTAVKLTADDRARAEATVREADSEGETSRRKPRRGGSAG
jgi:hypothetical protein